MLWIVVASPPKPGFAGLQDDAKMVIFWGCIGAFIGGCLALDGALALAFLGPKRPTGEEIRGSAKGENADQNRQDRL